MKPTRVAAHHVPSRIRIALAVAWMVASLAIGGAVSAEPVPDRLAPPAVTSSTAR